MKKVKVNEMEKEMIGEEKEKVGKDKHHRRREGRRLRI